MDHAVLDRGAGADARLGADAAAAPDRSRPARRRRSRRPTGPRTRRRAPVPRAGRSAPADTSPACPGPSSSSSPGSRRRHAPPRSPPGRSLARSRSRGRASTRAAPRGRTGRCPRSRRRASGPPASRGTPRRARPASVCHQAERARVLDVVQRDRDRGAALPMERDASRSDRGRCRMSPLSAKNGSSPTAGSALTIAPPVPSGSDSVIHVIVGSPWRAAMNGWNASSRYGERHHDLVHAVADEVVQLVVEDRPIDQREELLLDGLGERPQPRPEPADQHDRLHRCAPSPRATRSRRAPEARATPAARLRDASRRPGASRSSGTGCRSASPRADGAGDPRPWRRRPRG